VNAITHATVLTLFVFTVRVTDLTSDTVAALFYALRILFVSLQ